MDSNGDREYMVCSKTITTSKKITSTKYPYLKKSEKTYWKISFRDNSEEDLDHLLFSLLASLEVNTGVFLSSFCFSIGCILVIKVVVVIQEAGNEMILPWFL